MITDLQSEIIPYLQRAKTFYLATALINRGGYQVLMDHLPLACDKHYLIGINLPSCPEVLQELFLQSAEPGLHVRIYNARRTYHPKVYIIQTLDDKLYAFIGSANTTAGGLTNNIEMSVRIDSEETCRQLINWFEDLYKQSAGLNQDFIDQYRLTHQRVRSRNAIDRSDMSKLSSLLHPPIENSTTITVSANQFFTKNYFDAYQEKNWHDYSDAANDRRKSVRERFKQLHDLIYDRFEDYGMDDLFCHYQAQNITSSYLYREGFTRRDLKSMWLHYGYERSRIPKDSKFLNHPRIQVILEHDNIGIWLVIGKDHAAITERKQFREQMQHILAFRELSYQQVRSLGGSYWIYLADEEPFVSEFESADQLNDFIQDDDYTGYFIIGRTFNPSDELLSENNIAETVLLEFQRLYPLYKSFSI